MRREGLDSATSSVPPPAPKPQPDLPTCALALDVAAPGSSPPTPRSMACSAGTPTGTAAAPDGSALRPPAPGRSRLVALLAEREQQLLDATPPASRTAVAPAAVAARASENAVAERGTARNLQVGGAGLRVLGYGKRYKGPGATCLCIVADSRPQRCGRLAVARL